MGLFQDCVSMTPAVWQPDLSSDADAGPALPVPTAMARGIAGHCPACGQAPAFRGYLKIVPECRACGAPLGTARADDAPPYFTILIVGHIVVPLMVLWERAGNPSNLLLTAVFVPVTAALCLGLLRPVKGAVLGVMVALKMLKQPETPA
jgi:uncharacterized protein (DUF983 family)